jgi:hypothetical protein
VDPLLGELWQNQTVLRKKKKFFDFTNYLGTDVCAKLVWLEVSKSGSLTDL